jgi:heme oxygenase
LNTAEDVPETKLARAGRDAIAEEAREIFVRNMDLMTSVEGVSRVWTRWIFRSVIFAAIALAFFQILFRSDSIPPEPLAI